MRYRIVKPFCQALACGPWGLSTLLSNTPMTATLPLFVLLHSPLVGPASWAPVAVALRERGWESVVPPLWDNDTPTPPYWQQHAESVAQALSAVDPARPVILAGHSGAGPLLPVIGEHLAQPVAAYLFVEAGIPLLSASRLELMEVESPDWAAGFLQALLDGETFPQWTDADLAEIVPDAGRRRALLDEVRPRALPFFTEPIPTPFIWPGVPCAYLQFSAAYNAPGRWVCEADWPFRHLESGHFHMLVDPDAVAEAMLALVAAAGVS